MATKPAGEPLLGLPATPTRCSARSPDRATLLKFESDDRHTADLPQQEGPSPRSTILPFPAFSAGICIAMRQLHSLPQAIGPSKTVDQEFGPIRSLIVVKKSFVVTAVVRYQHFARTAGIWTVGRQNAGQGPLLRHRANPMRSSNSTRPCCTSTRSGTGRRRSSSSKR